MALDRPTFPGEAEIGLQSATLTSAGCTNPALALDDDPATGAVFAAGCPVPAGPVAPPASAPTAQIDGTDNTHVAWFGGGQSYPAGCYQVVYLRGAFSFNPAVADPWGMAAVVTDGAGNDLPFSMSPYFGGAGNVSQAAVEAAFGGQATAYAHSGGRIGVRCGDGLTTDNAHGSPDPVFALVGPAPRLLRADWGFDAFVTRVRLAQSGPGAANAGVDLESSLGLLETGADADVPIPYVPLPVGGGVHELTLSPPVLARGVAFYPDALAPAGQAGGALTLSQIQVYEATHADIGTLLGSGLGDTIMAQSGPNPTRRPARVGCSGITIFPRTAGLAYPFSAAQGTVLEGIQMLDFASSSKEARVTGGETVHQIDAYETDREIKGKFTVEKTDYRAMQLFLSGQLTTVPAGAGGPEVQYFAPNYQDRSQYVSVVALSVNGDPSELMVFPKIKLSGNLARNFDRDNPTKVEIDFLLLWDAAYPRQDGAIGGIYENLFSDGGALAIHS